QVLGLIAEHLLGAVRDVRAHPLGIGQAGLVLHVAVLDAGCLDDELRRALLQRLALAGGDLVRVLRVLAAHELVECGYQLVIREDIVRVPAAVTRGCSTSRHPRGHRAWSWSQARDAVQAQSFYVLLRTSVSTSASAVRRNPEVGSVAHASLSWRIAPLRSPRLRHSS